MCGYAVNSKDVMIMVRAPEAVKSTPPLPNGISRSPKVTKSLTAEDRNYDSDYGYPWQN